MPRSRLIVTSKNKTESLPDWATEFVVAATELKSRGVLLEFSRRFEVSRRDGYSSVDALMFLLAYFCSGLKIGLRPFSLKCVAHERELAAVCGRRHWPGSASISRFLSSVNDEQIGALESWFLNNAVNAGVIEKHASILCRDTHGEGWHVFDYDPTVTALRSRALPVGEELPEPRRRTAGMASAGYPGRKRGDLQFSRAMLQHAGSGMWLGITMSPGGGKARRDFEHAVSQTKAWCDHAEVDRSRAIIRSDGGGGGNIPAMTACIESGIQFVTRLKRYEVLDYPQVQAHLRKACWYDVEDSLSGPKRQAAELGIVRLSAGKRVTREDGGMYPELETRIVISRMKPDADGNKRGAGIARDGWWYELFSTSLDASAWPAPETVNLYYGRSGQENRFCQEDRELGLDRIFSYHLPGQRLASLVGLFVWNLRIARGADLVAPLPKKIPQQEARNAISTPSDESQETEATAELFPSSEVIETMRPFVDDEEDETERNEEPERKETGEKKKPSLAQRCQNALPILSRLNWKQHLTRFVDWKWDDTRGLLCPSENPFRLHEIISGPTGKMMLRWRSRKSSCRACPLRGRCSNSTSPIFRKEICFIIDGDDARMLCEYDASEHVEETLPPKPDKKSIVESQRPGWEKTPMENMPGAWQIAPSLLLPSQLRQAFRTACNNARAEVRVKGTTKKRRQRLRVIASCVEDRQQRRKTWIWRRKHNELSDYAEVKIILHGAAVLARRIGLAVDKKNAA